LGRSYFLHHPVVMILGDEKGIEDTFIINPKIVDLKTISEW
jgi:hypothetical protein